MEIVFTKSGITTSNEKNVSLKQNKNGIKNGILKNLTYLHLFYICSNPNIKLSDIEKLPIINWDGLSYNPNLTIEFIMKHINAKFNWNVLSSRIITLSDIETYQKLKKFISFVAFSGNKSLTSHFVIGQFEDLKWSWIRILSNSKTTSLTLKNIWNYQPMTIE